MRILAIDTSCDETSVAISENDRLLSNILNSQIQKHKQWGGVVPLIAKQKHIDSIDSTVEFALRQAKTSLNQIDIFAVTYGPGLAVALEVGIAKAKEMAGFYSKPLIGVNHMIGHIYANFVRSSNNVFYSKLTDTKIFPCIALLISGGHTELIYMQNHLDLKIIGQTLDDSIGEAFDKVANMLDLGYPGGPIIEKLAANSVVTPYTLPIPLRYTHNLDFSYSGLKTATLNLIQKIGQVQPSKFELNLGVEPEAEPNGFRPTFSKKNTYLLEQKEIYNVAHAFQIAAAEELAIKLNKALKIYPVKTVLLGGGVVNNKYIRTILRRITKQNNAKLFYPVNTKLLSDNAAMIAITAYYMFQMGKFTKSHILDRIPSLSSDKL